MLYGLYLCRTCTGMSFLCVCSCQSLCQCVCLCTSVHLHLLFYLSLVSACLSHLISLSFSRISFLSLYLCIYDFFVFQCVCADVCVCMCMYLCVYVCAGQCTCLSLWTQHNGQRKKGGKMKERREEARAVTREEMKRDRDGER